MGLSCYSGFFTINTTVPAPAGTGNKSISGLGFQPKIIIFFPCSRSTTGSNGHSMLSIGASTGAGNNYTGFVFRDENSAGTSNAARLHSATKSILKSEGNADATEYSGTVVSFDADGFTVNIDKAAPGARNIAFLALGGTDIQNVEVGNFNFSTAASGTQDVALSGAFKPDALILLTASMTGTGDTWTPDAHATVGFTDGNNQYCNTMFSDDNKTEGTNQRKTKNTCIAMRTTGAGGVDYEFSFNSFLSNGFRLNIVTAAAAAYTCVYIAIKGLRFYAGDYTERNTTGDITTESAAVGFSPKAILFLSGLILSWTENTDAKMLLGVTTGTEAVRANSNILSGAAAQDAADPTESYSTHNITHCCGQVKTSGGTFGTQVLKSFDALGFTMNQDVVADDLNIIPYLAIGERAAPALKIAIEEVWKDVTEIKAVIGETWKAVTEANLDQTEAWKTI